MTPPAPTSPPEAPAPRSEAESASPGVTQRGLLDRLPGGLASRGLSAGLFAAFLQVVGAEPTGLLWAHLSPRLHADQALAQGSFAAYKPLFSGDAHFLVIGGLVAAVAAALGWVAARGRHPVGLLVGAVVGAVLAIPVSGRIGEMVRLDPLQRALRPAFAQGGDAAAQAHLIVHLVGFGIRAELVYLVLPLVAALTILTLVAVTDVGDPATPATAPHDPDRPWYLP